jgi:hypothetical protein
MEFCSLLVADVSGIGALCRPCAAKANGEAVGYRDGAQARRNLRLLVEREQRWIKGTTKDDYKHQYKEIWDQMGGKSSMERMGKPTSITSTQIRVLCERNSALDITVTQLR